MPSFGCELAGFSVHFYAILTSRYINTRINVAKTDLILLYVYCSFGLNADSFRSNESDDEYDDETSPSGQDETYGADAVLAWAEVCLFIFNSVRILNLVVVEKIEETSEVEVVFRDKCYTSSHDLIEFSCHYHY